MQALGVIGWSGSGKTTLVEKIVPILRRRGLSVSTVKHAHHGFDMDRPGKDSFRHRMAGAREVMVVSGGRWALLHELDGADAPDAAGAALASLLARMAPVDLILVEGFKTHPFPKIEVYRPSLGKPPIWPDVSDIAAVASDATLPDCELPILPLNDAERVVVWMIQMLENGRAALSA